MQARQQAIRPEPAQAVPSVFYRPQGNEVALFEHALASTDETNILGADTVEIDGIAFYVGFRQEDMS